jgi:hypothetical protein
MGLWGPADYWLVRFLFRRGLALTYLLAFLVAAFQFRALAGEDGIYPLSGYVDRERFRDKPSLFYLFPSDRAVTVAAWLGVALSALALAGVTEQFGTPVSMGSWALLWVLYQSFVNAGQRFYGFGWGSMLLETGFLAIFLGAGEVAPPWLVVWLLRWMLFRNMFGAGLIKGKPTDTGRRPPQVAPYHLRLDWQLWFAAMSPSPRRHPWVLALVAHLLEGDEELSGLLRTDPFPEEPPTHVRIERYRYRFTTPGERAETGRIWERERVNTYLDPVSLDDPRFRAQRRRYRELVGG